MNGRTADVGSDDPETLVTTGSTAAIAATVVPVAVRRSPFVDTLQDAATDGPRGPSPAVEGDGPRTGRSKTPTAQPATGAASPASWKLHQTDERPSCEVAQS